MLPVELLDIPSHARARLRWAIEVKTALTASGVPAARVPAVIAAGLGVTMLVAYRLSLGLTQQAVADLYNDRWACDPPKTAKTITAWEAWRLSGGGPVPRKVRTPSMTDLVRLAILFDCTVDDLLTTTGTSGKAEALIAAPASGIPATAPQRLRRPNGETESATNRRQALQAAALAALSPLTTRTPVNAQPSRQGPVTLVSPPVLDSIAETVRRAQRLDDAGSGARAYVADQANTVERILRRDRYDLAAGRELHRCLAQLAQTAGFMHYDAGLSPAARNWYDIALAAAGEADDPSLRASILSLMSNEAATDGRASEAVALSSAARYAAHHAHPIVRALVAARSGLAHAANGDLTGLQRAQDLTHHHFDGTLTDNETPPWAYYVSLTELDAIIGRSMVTLVRTTGHDHAVLVEAEELLRGRALSAEAAYGRSGLLHASWLALAYAHAGEPEQAIAVGRHALQSGHTVISHRSTDLLHQLHSDMARYSSAPGGTEFRIDLHAYLTRARPPKRTS